MNKITKYIQFFNRGNIMKSTGIKLYGVELFVPNDTSQAGFERIVKYLHKMCMPPEVKNTGTYANYIRPGQVIEVDRVGDVEPSVLTPTERIQEIMNSNHEKYCGCESTRHPIEIQNRAALQSITEYLDEQQCDNELKSDTCEEDVEERACACEDSQKIMNAHKAFTDSIIRSQAQSSLTYSDALHALGIYQNVMYNK